MKKNYVLVLLLALLCTSFSQTVRAHALWIESSPSAKKNVTQTVKVFYGEYEHGTRDLLKEWYSDLKELELYILHPNGKSIKLETHEANDHLVAQFTPEQDGLYLIHTSHAAAELGGKTKYIFGASLPIAVNQSVQMIVNNKESGLLVFASSQEQHLGQNIDIYVLDKGIACQSTDVTVISSEGWAKTFKTDTAGKISFAPLWKGMYVVETSKYAPEEGVWHDQAHTHVWQSGTSTFHIH